MKQVTRYTCLASYTMLMMLVVGAALFRVWVHQDAVHLGYALSQAEDQREKLAALLQELTVEVAAAHSPQQLVSMGKALKLQPPKPAQLVGGTVGSRLARADTWTQRVLVVGHGRP